MERLELPVLWAVATLLDEEMLWLMLIVLKMFLQPIDTAMVL